MARSIIHRSSIGPDGFVPVWEFSANGGKGGWVRKHPIDAREMLDFGAGSLDAPAEAPPEPAPIPEPVRHDPLLHGPVDDED